MRQKTAKNKSQKVFVTQSSKKSSLPPRSVCVHEQTGWPAVSKLCVLYWGTVQTSSVSMPHRGNVTEQLTLRAVPGLVPRCVHEATLLNSTGGEEGREAQVRPQQQSSPQV